MSESSMWRTNLKVLATTLLVIGFYTGVAHVIPQLQSEVPEALSLTGDMTPEVMVAAGERVYNGAGGCAACHGLGTRAPNLLTDHAGQGPIGARCGSRVKSLDCKAYLYQSMTNPGGYIVPGFEPIMPDMRRQLSEDQIWATVAFLEAQGGEVTVTAADMQAAAKPAGSPAPAGAAAATSTTDPTTLLSEKGCLGCHQFGGKGAAIGPPLDHIGATRDATYLRRAILQPNAEIAKGYEKFAGVMPATFGQQLTAAQLEALVQFLAARK